ARTRDATARPATAPVARTRPVRELHGTPNPTNLFGRVEVRSGLSERLRRPDEPVRKARPPRLERGTCRFEGSWASARYPADTIVARNGAPRNSRSRWRPGFQDLDTRTVRAQARPHGRTAPPSAADHLEAVGRGSA